MLSIGEKAPEFALKNAENETVTLSQFKGKKVVLFFYPKDDTPGCTKESIDFSEKIEEFEAENTVIIGISKDSVESHQKFRDKYQLKVILLSDPERKMIEDYHVWQEKKNYGKTYMGIVRTTYLIDESGNIEKIWKNEIGRAHV